MINHDILVYLIIGLAIGLFFQLIHDIAVRIGGISEEELPDFTFDDHIRLVLFWPFVLLGVLVRSLQKK